MKYNWVLVFMWFCLKAVHSQRLLEDDCPEPEDIAPCKCEGSSSERIISCYNVNNADTLRTVFQNAEGYHYAQIHISYSSLQYIPREILEKTSAKELTLTDMKLNQIFDKRPREVPSITEVMLHNVRVLRNISWSSFQGFTELEDLTLIGTPIGILGPSFSKYMSKNLVRVYFRDLKIKEIQKGALSQLSNLMTVRFDKCSLTSLTRDIFPRPWVKISFLDLEGNKISSIPEDLFTDMPNLIRLYLDHNLISELPESAFQGSSLDDLRLSGNPLKCNCQMRWLLKKELVKRYSGVCASPKRLEGKQLEDLTASDFRCIGNTLTDLD